MLKSTPTLGNLLIQADLVTEEQVQTALAEQARTHERIGEILSRLTSLSTDQIQDALGRQLGLKRFNPAKKQSDPAALELIPVEFSRRHNLLPIHLGPETLIVAMADPLDVEARDQLEQIAKRIR